MTEEEAYAQVVAELAARDLRPGLWGKAMAESLGNDSVAKSIYLKLRAEQILVEHHAIFAARRRQEGAEREARAGWTPLPPRLEWMFRYPKVVIGVSIVVILLVFLFGR